MKNFILSLIFYGSIGIAIALILKSNNEDNSPCSKTQSLFSQLSPEILESKILNTGVTLNTSKELLIPHRRIVSTVHINQLSSFRIVSQLLLLEAQDSSSEIDLYIRSTGGYVDDAFSILQAIQLLKPKVNIYAMGGCYSSCSMLLAGATGKRFAFENSLLNIHFTKKGTNEHGELYRKRFEKHWKKYANFPNEWFPMISGEEKFLTAKDAKRLGIIDHVLSKSK